MLMNPYRHHRVTTSIICAPLFLKAKPTGVRAAGLARQRGVLSVHRPLPVRASQQRPGLAPPVRPTSPAQPVGVGVGVGVGVQRVSLWPAHEICDSRLHGIGLAC